MWIEAGGLGGWSTRIKLLVNIITFQRDRAFPTLKLQKTGSKEEYILGGETVLTTSNPQPISFLLKTAIRNSLPIKPTAYREGESSNIGAVVASY